MGCKECYKIKRDKKENRRKMEYCYYYFASICLTTSCGIIILNTMNNINGGLFAGFLFGISLMALATIFDKFIDSKLELNY